MNTRLRCRVPPQSIATSQADCANLPEPASIPDLGEVYCDWRGRLNVEPPTSTAGPHGRMLRDRRDSRVDIVGTGRAFDIHYVSAGAQKPRATRGKPQ